MVDTPGQLPAPWRIVSAANLRATIVTCRFKSPCTHHQRQCLRRFPPSQSSPSGEALARRFSLELKSSQRPES